MNYKTLALASLFLLAAGIASANTEVPITGPRIQDVGFDKQAGRYYGTKQGPFYQYLDPNSSEQDPRYYATKYWENEPAAPCGDCGRCNLCAPACSSCG